MHDTHLSWINDKSNASKRAAYTSARSAAQRGLRQMKKQWWLNKAVELQHRLWREHGISLKTKVEVYRAVVLTTILFGSECWTLYRRHIKQLEQFHTRCLRKIAGIRWQDRVSNTRVLEMCGISGIEAFLLQSQFPWVGHSQNA